MRLNAASQNCGVFRSAEVHRILADVHTFDGITSLRKDVDKRLIVRQVDCFTHFFDGVFATLTQCAALDDLNSAVIHILIDFAGFSAHFHLHDGVGRNDVAAFTRVELPHIDASHARTVTSNAQQLHKRIASRSHRVASSVGFYAGMCRTTRIRHIHLRRAKESIRIHGNLARLAHHGNVSTEEEVCIINNA